MVAKQASKSYLITPDTSLVRRTLGETYHITVEEDDPNKKDNIEFT